jgi:excisionase family DNA binding protein
VPTKKMPVSVPAPGPRMLNVRAAAEYLGATVWFVRTIAWEKKIRSVIFGNRLLFDRADLDAFIDRAKAGAV